MPSIGHRQTISVSPRQRPPRAGDAPPGLSGVGGREHRALEADQRKLFLRIIPE